MRWSDDDVCRLHPEFVIAEILILIPRQTSLNNFQWFLSICFLTQKVTSGCRFTYTTVCLDMVDVYSSESLREE